MEHSNLVTAKITFDVLHALQELGDSLHVRRNFCCLIQVGLSPSKKLILFPSMKVL